MQTYAPVTLGTPPRLASFAWGGAARAALRTSERASRYMLGLGPRAEILVEWLRSSSKLMAMRSDDPDSSVGAAQRAEALREELSLMERIAEGDAKAYRVLSERYLRRIVSYAARVLGDLAEAEDVAQETFLRLWTRAERFEPRAKPSTWLYRVAHNLCVDRLRARRPGDPDALEQQLSGDRPSLLLARKQLASAVQAALSELPERQRAAIVLSHYEGLSNPEAAEVLGVGVEAVESLLSRGRRALKERLLSVHEQSKESP